mgnify:CR=1 FL=1
MHHQRIHRFCLALMLAATLVRFAGQVQAYLDWKSSRTTTLWRVDVDAAPVPLVHQTPLPAGLSVSAPAAQKADEPSGEQPAASGEDAAAPEEPSQNAPAEPSEPLVFSPEEADAIAVAGGCTYDFDKQALLMQPTTLDFSGDGPKILIVHTHASEAYTQEPGFTYEPSDTLRTQDETRSVIRIGSEIARILEDAGIETLHDTTHNDYPSYDGSYARMQTIIASYLAQYPSIQMVLDVHRDAVEDRAGFPAALTVNIDSEEYARLMLVVGTDEGGLAHPRWQENLANALKLQALLNRQAPGLCRDIDLRTERFNQHETDGSLLCEFGASGNTLSQALRTARVFADVLVGFVNGVGAGT